MTDNADKNLEQNVEDSDKAPVEPKGTEETLRGSEVIHRLPLKDPPALVVLLDESGRYISANKAALEFFECDLVGLLGKEVSDLTARDFSKQQRDKLLLCTTPCTVEIDFLILGKRKRLSLNVVPSTLSGKKFVCAIGHDISENKRIETEKKKLEVQVKQDKERKAIRKLAGSIAHKINNLLTVIQGYASLMLMNIDSSHPHFEKLKGIESLVKDGADFTKQLLSFAGDGEYEVKATDLNEIIDKTVEMFGHHKTEIRIHRIYQKDTWTVEVNHGQIARVLLSLYLNASEAMPGGGELYLRTENVTLDEDYVKPFDVKPGNYVMISVTDTGVGMDEPTRQRIFEPFFTTKVTAGAGLGLASAYGLIKSHGGIITVHSKKGEGTTFYMYLPASKEEVRKEQEPVGGVLKGTETVLLVDDDETVIVIAGEIMESMGYKVLLARSGKEAIEVYKKNKDRIDMVVLDMVMPEMSGGEAYDRIKEINPNIKALLASGYSMDGQGQQILERGCNGYIQKPFNIEQLSHKLREILDN
ncbi:MAG: response regulator [Deltaproteobacteria bacterium]|nr:response regulator [Deltaproteobacteria bacterium]